jgi:hypothetical protein
MQGSESVKRGKGGRKIYASPFMECFKGYAVMSLSVSERQVPKRLAL